MQAVLKGLHSPDIADVEHCLPYEEDNFGFLLQAMVGPMDGEGEESFDIIVCTPKWLMDKYGGSEVLLGLHKEPTAFAFVRLHKAQQHGPTLCARFHSQLC